MYHKGGIYYFSKKVPVYKKKTEKKKKMSDHDVEISVSDSSSDVKAKPQKHSSDDDKPNIVINDQKEVHMKVSEGSSDDGSITAQESKPIQTDPSKDPEIKPEKKQATAKDPQSQCCLLI